MGWKELCAFWPTPCPPPAEGELAFKMMWGKCRKATEGQRVAYSISIHHSFEALGQSIMTSLQHYLQAQCPLSPRGDYRGVSELGKITKPDILIYLFDSKASNTIRGLAMGWKELCAFKPTPWPPPVEGELVFWNSEENYKNVKTMQKRICWLFQYALILLDAICDRLVSSLSGRMSPLREGTTGVCRNWVKKQNQTLL